ncbi:MULTISPECIES: hypothetical protein [Bacillus]|uniref:hypothetical protein n=1 Tax=Bacillus sp. SKDU12 TaxID=1337053 RepID=UPI00138A1C39|nr:hypothetical protein BTW01_04835 [Bacillus sp. SKDU12]
MDNDPSDYTVTQESVLKLIREQKRMNREMIAELEEIHGPLPISHDIQYIKVLLDSSNTHIVRDLMSVSKQLFKKTL